jgi:biopolymer transport protein ExbB/TolQ
MAHPELPAAERLAGRKRRSFATLAAFLFGVPAAAAILTAIQSGPLNDPELQRYVQHGVEQVEVLLFCCALAALVVKIIGSVRERLNFRRELLPAWDGRPISASEAGGLLDGLRRLGRWGRNSTLARRVVAVLDFVDSRQSANDLDDQLRALADNDAMFLEGSYALTRFITWAIPILGFLGTVLGITQAISGVTPEKMQNSFSTVTDGLAEAFDCTALALALTMIVMFVNFLAERCEEGLLLAVDQYVDEHLAHRFERSGPESGEFVETVKRHTQVLVKATEQLVHRQAELWSRSLTDAQQQWAATGRKQQEAVTAALETALERTLDSHARRLAELEEHNSRQGAALLERLAALTAAVRESTRDQQQGLTELAQSVASQTEALAKLDAGSGQLVRLQEALSHNLNVLAGAGAFEQAVGSLTAAIHLLTTRVGTTPAAAPKRPGIAA